MKRFYFFILLLYIAPAAIAQEEGLSGNECWFTASQDSVAYQDASLAEPHVAVSTIQAGWSFPVEDLTAGKALLTIGDALGFWIRVENGVLTGDCERYSEYQPVEAHVLANTRIWSQPDVITGEVVTSLQEGTVVTVIGGRAIGRISYGSDQTANWYPVRYDTLSGWVWAGRLDFETIASPDLDAITLNNARLWTEPDVVGGNRILDVPKNMAVEIIGGPVTGRIRFDNDTTGVWYQIRVRNVIGWIWEDRLKFE